MIYNSVIYFLVTCYIMNGYIINIYNDNLKIFIYINLMTRL